MGADDAGTVPVTAPDPRTNRLAALTGLRGVGALLIFGGHAIPWLDNTRLSGARRLLASGITGVSFFFMLSGFVLVWGRTTRVPAATFYRRRFARVWPAHVTIVVVVCALAVLEGEHVAPGPLAASLLLVQSWVPRARYYFGVNGVAWSLSCEVFFYALSPWLLPALGRLARRARRYLLVALVAAVFVPPALFPHHDVEFANTHAWFTYIFPVTRLLEFCAGALLAHEMLDGGWRWAELRWTVPPALAAFVVAGYFPFTFGVAAITMFPFLALMAALVNHEAQGRRNPLAHPWMVLLGAWAYAFYLTHELLLLQVDRIVGSHAGQGTVRALVVIGVSLVLSLVAAGSLFTLVERPAERWIRHGGRRIAPGTEPLPLASPGPAAAADPPCLPVEGAPTITRT